MSKSRGNFLDPNDVVAAFGADGARYVALREVPFDSDADVSWDGFVRRYNADLANDFGNLVNRTVSMAEPLPRRRAAGAARRTERRSATAWAEPLERYVDALEALPAPRRARARSGSSSARRTGSSTRSSRGRWRRRRRPATRRPASRLRGVLGDLVEACRLIGLAAAPFLPDDGAARRSRSSATPTRTGRTATAVRRSSTSCAGAPTPASPAR